MQLTIKIDLVDTPRSDERGERGEQIERIVADLVSRMHHEFVGQPIKLCDPATGTYAGFAVFEE